MKLNGVGKRAHPSWVDAFIEHTDNLDSPVIFRRWSAISCVAAALEQKVWLTTSSPLHPNLYVFIVGGAASGKTRAIRAMRNYYAELPDSCLAPTSMTCASMVDELTRSKRTIIRMPDPPLEYNTMFMAPDEIGAFMSEYEKNVISTLSAFYDPDPYGQTRRGDQLRIKIKSPQVNLICGVVPSVLMTIMPEIAWTQGFTSRIIMVFSGEQIIGDDFATPTTGMSDSLIHDLKMIYDLCGEFEVTADYRNAINNWLQLGSPPVPTHPKLFFYNSRRKVHLYKLSMIAALERSNALILTTDDFNRAMGWLLEAEVLMPDVFKAGVIGSDGKVMDDLHHFAKVHGDAGLPEAKLVREARKYVPAHSVMRVLEIMERSGMIKAFKLEARTGMRWYKGLFTDDL